MAQGCGRDAVDAVLSNPDLAYRILENLPPVPPSIFHAHRSATQNSLCSDRGVAARVNRAFRHAALRFPWSLSWSHRIDKTTASEDLAAAARFIGSRNVQSLELRGKLEGLAAALCRATSLESLTLGFSMEELSADWAQHTRLQLEGVGGSTQPTSLTACLSLLTRLTSLRVQSSWPMDSSASWLLAAAPQLQHLALQSWSGPPLEGGPHLKSLNLSYMETDQLQGTLDQWAAPGLTALSICISEGLEGLVLGPSRRGNVARELQRLHLDQCCFDLQSVGLRDMFPCLTHLFIGNFTEDWPPEFRCAKGDHSVCLDALLSKGLPVSLRELTIRILNNVAGVPRYAMQAISRLTNLEALELRLVCCAPHVEVALEMTDEDRSQMLLSDSNVKIAFKTLISLPSLRTACLEFHARDEALLKERCRALRTHLGKRGGYLLLCTFFE